ncbi:DUF4893 domain-containing protein [uncultured Sphingomonas sp.]|uniref:DUF4893 domain-containing protein n=1 Tax=uncultured Sphingomonas sp. TaxID=158754 RepID=UPI002636DE1B|nr:DUF4893 domain-containing protein [uncultured Sphingomonas sp.]
MGLLIALTAAVAACQAGAAAAPQAAPQASAAAEGVVPDRKLPERSASSSCAGVEAAWRHVATQNDRARLRNWRTLWVEALAKAKAAGGADEIARDEALFNPDLALDRPIPPAGDYRCRIIKLGAKAKDNKNFVTLPPANCTVGKDGGESWFVVNDGIQRPIGRFFAGPPGRGIFLGTLELGDERRPLEYGLDAKRDMIAYLDRVGDKRWRLIVPSPHFDATIEVIEIASVP